MQLPQSTVSRHLKALADAGWIASRAEGTSRLYTMTPRRARRLPRGGSGCWCANRSGPRRRRRRTSAGCRRRWPSGAPSRRSSSRRRPASGIALRDELFGDRFHLAALAGARRQRLDRRRSRLRHRPGQRRARAVRRARHRGRRVGRDAAGGEEAAARHRQRRAAARRARGAADRRRAARRRDADAGAAPRAGAGARARRGRARAEAGRPRLSSTCCRTIARATASRWATSGSGSPTTTCAACFSDAGFEDVRIVALPPDAKLEGTGVVRRNRTQGCHESHEPDTKTVVRSSFRESQ